METPINSFKVEKVVPLANKDYYWFLLDSFRRARKRIWVTMFIVSVERASDPMGEVRTLVKELARAKSNGVDVRFMTGHSDLAPIARANQISRLFAATKGLPQKVHRPLTRESTHQKVVIIDNEILIVGSHNWLHESFNEALEDSIAVYSRELVMLAATEFRAVWTAPSTKEVNKA